MARAKGYRAREALREARGPRPVKCPKGDREALEEVLADLERRDRGMATVRYYRDGTRLQVQATLKPDQDWTPKDAGLGDWHKQDAGKVQVTLGPKVREVPRRVKVGDVFERRGRPPSYWEPEGYSIPERVRDYWEAGKTFPDALAQALREVREEEHHAREDWTPSVLTVRVVLTDGVRDEELAMDSLGGLDGGPLGAYWEMGPRLIKEARAFAREARSVLGRRETLASKVERHREGLT